MPSTIAIRLDEELEKLLDREVLRTGLSKSDVVRNALRTQLGVSAFQEARRKTIPLAEAIGWFTDEDVFKEIS